MGQRARSLPHDERGARGQGVELAVEVKGDERGAEGSCGKAS